MIGLSHVQAFCASAAMLSSAEALKDLLADMTRRMGFTYFALVHHIELTNAGHRINLVEYPPEWIECFEARRLYACDPIHRASQRTSVGFIWSASMVAPGTPARPKSIASSGTIPGKPLSWSCQPVRSRPSRRSARADSNGF